MTRWRKAQIVFHINLYWCLYDGVMLTIRVRNNYFFSGYAVSTHLRSFTKFQSIWLYVIKLSWIKSCRQIFVFKFTFANYLLCNEPCIILYSYLCSSKLFRVLLLILLLSFQIYMYDVFGRSNCSNILMAKKIHLWTIRGLQGT